MQYQITLNYQIEAENEQQAKEQAIAYAKIQPVMPYVVSPMDIFNQLKTIRSKGKEHFCVFLLDTQNHITKKEVVSVGTLNASLIHPREVFRSAILANCASVIVAHNHPSGSLEPSDEDLSVTRRLKQVGELVGIHLLDHVIVTANGYTSLKEKNLI